MTGMINRFLFALNFAFAVLGLVQIINGDTSAVSIFAVLLNTLAAVLLFRVIRRKETPVNEQPN